jgi:hypothetical protein
VIDDRMEAVTPAMLRAEAALEARLIQAARVQLFVQIKTSSKYYGQGAPGMKFPVRLQEHPCGYVFRGGPGGQYRREDVHIFATVDGTEIQLA